MNAQIVLIAMALICATLAIMLSAIAAIRISQLSRNSLKDFDRICELRMKMFDVEHKLLLIEQCDKSKNKHSNGSNSTSSSNNNSNNS